MVCVRLRQIAILILFPLVIFSQNSLGIDSVLLKTGQKISGNISRFYDSSVSITENNHARGIAIHAVQNIWFDNLGLIFSEQDGFLVTPDSLNKIVQLRNDISDQSKYGKHEISIFFGGSTTSYIRDGKDDDGIALDSWKGVTFSGKTPVQIQMGYRYISNSDVSIGFHFGYEKYGTLFYANSEYIGDRSTFYLTIAAEVSYYWINRDWFQLYSGLGFGFTFLERKYNNLNYVSTGPNDSYAIQVDFIGLRIGYKAFLLLEIGGGYAGILTAGIAYQL